MRQAMIERTHPAGMGGVQKLYRFQNNYGASVVQFPYSYGGQDGKWEMAVVHFDGEGEYDYELRYDTPITDDVLGYLSEAAVDNYLAQIEALPPDDGGKRDDDKE